MKRLLLVAVITIGSIACSSQPATERQKAPPTPVAVTDAAASHTDPVAPVKAALRELDRKIAAHERALAQHPADITDSAWVKKKLATMAAIDQLIRKADAPGDFGPMQRLAFNRAIHERANRIDRANTRSLRALVKRHGWITRTRFGDVASQNAWLLAQHADRDLAFQKQVLELIEPLVAKNQVRASDYAYLYDRVAVAEKRPQRYGTQGRCTGPGTWAPHEIEDPEGVDERRKAAGLPPLAEYIRGFKQICRKAD